MILSVYQYEKYSTHIGNIHLIFIKLNLSTLDHLLFMLSTLDNPNKYTHIKHTLTS